MIRDVKVQDHFELKSIFNFTGSHCNNANTGVIWPLYHVLVKSLAVEF